jgi:hypothetical protein
VVSIWLLHGIAGATDVFIVTSPPHFGFHPTQQRRHDSRLAHWRLGYVAAPCNQVHLPHQIDQENFTDRRKDTPSGVNPLLALTFMPVDGDFK